MFHKIARTVKIFSFMLLSFQGRFLQKLVVKRLGYNGKKTVKGCSLELKDDDICTKEQLNEEVELILKTCKNNPDAVVKVFEGHKTPVYIVKRAEKALEFVKERDGFISERSGFTALYLNFITKHKLGFKTKPMVILEELNIYLLMRALHKWCAYKNGLAGLDAKSQKLLARFNSEKEDDVINKLSLNDIDKVRSAIARDVQSIDFVVQYSKDNEGARKALEKIKNEGGANI